MKKNILFVLGLLLWTASAQAQAVGINTDGSSPDPSSILDVKSTNKGMLVPRLSTLQREGITSPAAGLLVYDTDEATFWFFNGTAWTSLLIAETDPQVGSSATNHIPKWNGTTLTDGSIFDNGNVGIGTTSPSYPLHIKGTYDRMLHVQGSSPAGTWLDLQNTSSGGKTWNLISTGQFEAEGAGSLMVGVNLEPRMIFHEQEEAAEMMGHLRMNDHNLYLRAGNDDTNHGLGFFGNNSPNGRWNAYDVNGPVLWGNGGGVLGAYHLGTQVNALTWKLSGNVGIGTTSPAQKLDVVGTVKTVGFQMPTGAATGHVLQSDASGNGSWVSASSIETDPQVSSSTTSRVPRWTGTTLSDGSMFDNGTNVGIGTTSPSQKLEVNGTTRTTNFQMTNGATNGYVLQSDASGNASWIAPTSLSVTGDNLGNHTATQNINLGPWYLSNSGTDYGLKFLNGITLTQSGILAQFNLGDNTNPFTELSFYPQNQEWKLHAGADKFQLFDGSNGNSSAFVVEKQSANSRLYIKGDYVGIGTSSPAELLDVNGTVKTVGFQMPTGAASGYVLQSDASGNASWVAPTSLVTTTASKIQDTDADTKIQVEKNANEDKIRFDLGGTERWVMTGSRLEPVNTGNSVFIGIDAGINDDLNSSFNIGIGTNALRYSTGGSNVAVGVSAGRGTSTYAGSNNTYLGAAAGLNATGSSNVFVGLGTGVSNTGSGSIFMGYQAGANETGSNKLYIDNSNTSSPLIWGDFASDYVNINGNLGIGTTSPSQKLDVNGTTKTVGFRMPTGAASGYVLQSDASGNGTWVAPSGLSVTETDPQVGSSVTNYVPKWNGTTLTDGLLFDNGTNVGIGTTSPSQKLDVNGTTRTTNFQMTNGATNGYILQSDASGNASWVAPGSLVTDTDDQTLSLSGTTLSITGGNSVDIFQKQIKDTDGDTKIQMEESADEDKIRFDLGGTERWVMQGSRLESKNSGQSVFLGESAGASDDLTTNKNVAIGYEALNVNVTGVGNVGVGFQTLKNNTANSNTVVGYLSMISNVTGAWNTAFGQSALGSNIDGKYNVGLGGSSLLGNQTGNSNIAIGMESLFSNTDGSNNVSIGFQSGKNNTTGNGNVFLGYQAGLFETGSDKLYIANSNTSNPLIWGDFSSNYVNINGNLGIGTTSPSQKLDVQSSASVTVRSLSTGSHAYVNTTAPSGSETAVVFSTYASGNSFSRWIFGKSTALESGSNAGSDFFVNRYSDAGAYLDQPFKIKRSTGYVGIGPLGDPSAQLDVAGTTKTLGFQMTTGATDGYVLQSDASGNASWVSASSIETDPQVSSSTNSRVPRWTGSTLSDGTMFDNGTNVGIGTTSPANKLDVEGSLAIGSTYAGTSSAPSNGAIIEGNVGIGTSAPTTTLQVSMGNEFTDQKQLTLFTGSTSSSSGYQVFTAGSTGEIVKIEIIIYNFTFDPLNLTRTMSLYQGAGTSGALLASVTNTFTVAEAISYNAAFDVSVYVSSGVQYTIALDKQAYWGYNTNTLTGYSDGYSSLNSAYDFGFRTTMEGPGFHVTNEGVGIGTSSPTQAKLVIDGSRSESFANGYGFLNRNGAGDSNNNDDHDYSIYASDRMAASEFNAFSDARIKRVQGRSDNAADLETLMQLKITDYTLIDTVAKGTKPHKKVIAQEVEEVYPQAVSTIAGVTVPDIYRLSKIEGGFVALENSNLKPGERVKLIFGDKQEVTEVTAVSEKGFQTKLTAENSQVFVYGREVSDFRTVDYEALSMLNISATQELVKTIARQNEAINALKADNETMKAANASMKSDIQLIKAALQLNATATEK